MHGRDVEALGTKYMLDGIQNRVVPDGLEKPESIPRQMGDIDKEAASMCRGNSPFDEPRIDQKANIERHMIVGVPLDVYVRTFVKCFGRLDSKHDLADEIDVLFYPRPPCRRTRRKAASATLQRKHPHPAFARLIPPYSAGSLAAI